MKVSQVFPAWEWPEKSEKRIATLSYAQSMISRDPCPFKSLLVVSERMKFCHPAIFYYKPICYSRVDPF
jgi:hypothetical protein